MESQKHRDLGSWTGLQKAFAAVAGRGELRSLAVYAVNKLRNCARQLGAAV